MQRWQPRNSVNNKEGALPHHHLGLWKTCADSRDWLLSNMKCTKFPISYLVLSFIGTIRFGAICLPFPYLLLSRVAGNGQWLFLKQGGQMIQKYWSLQTKQDICRTFQPKKVEKNFVKVHVSLNKLYPGLAEARIVISNETVPAGSRAEGTFMIPSHVWQYISLFFFCPRGAYSPGKPGGPWTDEEVLIMKEKVRYMVDFRNAKELRALPGHCTLPKNCGRSVWKYSEAWQPQQQALVQQNILEIWYDGGALLEEADPA